MERTWTLETARALLGEVRERTGSACAAVEALEARIEARRGEPAEARALAEALRERVSRWMREMEALGVRVEGPWQVLFETEGGAFCWAWPEEELTRFRASEAIHATPIQ